MINEERLLRILYSPLFSEKASFVTEKTNTVILKVARHANKAEIKAAVQQLFTVEVKGVNTLIVKSHIQYYKKRISKRNNWKKAYVTLKKDQHLNFNINNTAE